jgi:hypothetical protein
MLGKTLGCAQHPPYGQTYLYFFRIVIDVNMFYLGLVDIWIFLSVFCLLQISSLAYPQLAWD